MIAGPAHSVGRWALATGTGCSAGSTTSLTGIGTVADPRFPETAEPTWSGCWGFAQGTRYASSGLKTAGLPPLSGAKKLNQYTGLSPAAPGDPENVLVQGNCVTRGRAPPGEASTKAFRRRVYRFPHTVPPSSLAYPCVRARRSPTKSWPPTSPPARLFVRSRETRDSADGRSFDKSAI